jgi:hypothetical protein
VSRLAAILRRTAVRVLWLAAAAVIAAGSAGIVAGVGGPPTVVSRPELTWAGDRAMQPGFAAALSDLTALDGQVDQLGTLGRAALAALAARDQDRLESAISDGGVLVSSIDANATRIRRNLRALPGIDGLAPPLPPGLDLTLGTDVQAHYTALDSALDAASGLSDGWVRLTAGSLAAIHLVGVLAEHDASTATAARLGRGAHYRTALNQLQTSKALLDDATKQRNTLANTVDVTTLSRWIDLNAAYDAALRKLYAALLSSGGRATAAVKSAIAAEAAAHAQLPPDTRGLVVIMGEIARGGLNQAVIGIEEARGDLDGAIASLGGQSPAEAAPEPSPAASDGTPPTPTEPTATSTPGGPTASPPTSFAPIVTPAPTH